MKYFLLLTTVFFSLNLSAVDISLYGEGKSGVVKLVWVVHEWTGNDEGFVLKRKTSEKDDWEVMTTTPIVHEMAAEGDLKDRVLTEDIRQEFLKIKAEKLKAGDWKLTTPKQFVEALSDEKKAAWIRYAMKRDYPLAVCSGFGFVDKPTDKSDEYIYGLFLKEDQEEPTAQVKVAMDVSSYDLEVKSDLEITRSGKSLEAKSYWLLDAVSFRKDYRTVEVFCTEQVKDKEESDPVEPGISKPGPTRKGFGAFYFHNEVDDSLTTTYRCYVKTIFGSSHEIGKKVLDPSAIPPPADQLYLKTLPFSDEGYDLAQGLPPIRWDFKEEDEKFIKGFIIKMDSNRRMVQVSGLIDKSKRSYTYPQKPLNRKYYYFKVEAILNEGFGKKSSEKQGYYYKYVKKAPAPELQYEWVERGGGNYVRIFWTEDNKVANTTSYRILSSSSGRENWYSCPTDGKNLKSPEYYFPVQDRYAEDYFFKVAQVSANDDVGTWSAPLKVITRTTKMPLFNIFTVEVEENIVNVQWTEMYELKDFDKYYVYVDGKLIETYNWGPTKVNFEYKKNGKHQLKVIAKTIHGLTVEDTRTFTIEK